MKCNQCQYSDTNVIESRDVVNAGFVRRRRQCPKCNYRFTTYERVERPQLIVLKKDGSREIFNRNKVLAGINRACEKTAITNIQIESLIDNVEQELYGRGEPEVSSREIGELVIKGLSGLNDVAYVRFASVYRRFDDITGFEKELATIRAKREDKKTNKQKK